MGIDGATTAYGLAFTTIAGDTFALSSLQGKVALVVNTASCCGFTGQYADLQTLWERYRDHGFVLLGVPSNDFGGQEPGSESEIKSFCDATYGIDFPMMAKVHVKGDAAHPFYRWAAEVRGALAKPRWNFHKYLIGPDGHLADWFSTVTKPSSPKVIRAIEAQLARIEA